MELMSFTKTAVDVMQEAQDSAKKEAQVSLKTSSEATPAQALPGPPINDRAKIVITIQDKDGQKQFRVFADEKFERVFKMYTDKEKLDPQNLVFTFDGDKIDPSTTPSNLEMEDGDMIELKLGSNCGLCSEAFSKVNARLPNLECQSIRSSLPEFVHQHGTWKGISAKDSADAASLCLTCDAKVHSANALSGRHLRTLLCGFCKNQPCVVRCLDHKMFLCNGCNEKIHGVVSSKHVRHDVRCYTGCPSAKDFAVMWGFRVMDNDVSLEKSFAMAKPKVQREAGFVLEQILELEKLQLREENKVLPLTEHAGPSPLELPKKSVECLVDLPQTGKDLIVDFSHLSSSSTLSDSFWECKSPFNKNNQLWHQNLQDIGVCEDTACDDDDFHIPDIDLTFQNFEELFGADPEPTTDNYKLCENQNPAEDQNRDDDVSDESPTSVIGNEDVNRSSLPKSISVRSSGYSKASQGGGGVSQSRGAIPKPATCGQQLTTTQKVYVRGGKKEEEEEEEIEVEVYNQGMTKTELCNKWQETGACSYGDHCQFAHGIKELRPVIRHPRYKTEVCRMVLAGDICPYGHRCHFRHSLSDQEKLTAAGCTPNNKSSVEVVK
ncbi:unnamed protein product [Brassica oleracea]